MLPLFADFLLQLGTQGIDRAGTVAPGVRTAGVEDRAAIDEIAGIALVRVHCRIEGVLQQPSMTLIAVLGSQRVDTAQITSFISDGSMSSSTTMTKRP